MGKASREKWVRRADNAAAMTVNKAAPLSFQCGMQWPSETPVICNFYVQQQLVVPGLFTIDQARDLGNRLLKYAELAERKEREAKGQPV